MPTLMAIGKAAVLAAAMPARADPPPASCDIGALQTRLA
jgi:hypothetical protein